jgi:LPPG:FO 2-phospho-L-lactate transferase
VIAVIAGGVGAARFLRGLLNVVDPADVTAIVNTADDIVLHGLHISPDLDTVTYTLAGAINPETGWGLDGETWQAMTLLERYGGEAWFRLGDRDLATHLYRTQRLGEGASLSEVTAEITRTWGLGLRVLPMSDDPVTTMVTVPDDGEIGFQEYFVGRRHAVATEKVRFAGVEAAAPAPGVLAAIAGAARVVIAPSNPIVSIGPVLALPGLRETLADVRDRTVAISPIVAGAALKGPADRMLATLGHEVSAYGVAALYAGLVDGLAIDVQDLDLAARIEELGIRPLVTQTVMGDAADRRRLADEVLAFGRGLPKVRDNLPTVATVDADEGGSS